MMFNKSTTNRKQTTKKAADLQRNVNSCAPRCYIPFPSTHPAWENAHTASSRNSQTSVCPG